MTCRQRLGVFEIHQDRTSSRLFKVKVGVLVLCKLGKVVVMDVWEYGRLETTGAGRFEVGMKDQGLLVVFWVFDLLLGLDLVVEW
ncbi:hypothetical protein Droror1_Dr00021797 [Drosera rotundifolia]